MHDNDVENWEQETLTYLFLLLFLAFKFWNAVWNALGPRGHLSAPPDLLFAPGGWPVQTISLVSSTLCFRVDLANEILGRDWRGESASESGQFLFYLPACGVALDECHYSAFLVLFSFILIILSNVFWTSVSRFLKLEIRK